MSLFANYDSLKTFEERLEYVYTCLKKVEQNKLAQVSDLDGEGHVRMIGSHSHTTHGTGLCVMLFCHVMSYHVIVSSFVLASY